MQILSDTVIINKIADITTEYIELSLKNLYPNIIRWAVVDITDDRLKISVTYEKGV